MLGTGCVGVCRDVCTLRSSLKPGKSFPWARWSRSFPSNGSCGELLMGPDILLNTSLIWRVFGPWDHIIEPSRLSSCSCSCSPAPPPPHLSPSLPPSPCSSFLLLLLLLPLLPFLLLLPLLIFPLSLLLLLLFLPLPLLYQSVVFL